MSNNALWLSVKDEKDTVNFDQKTCESEDI